MNAVWKRNGRENLKESIWEQVDAGTIQYPASSGATASRIPNAPMWLEQTALGYQTETRTIYDDEANARAALQAPMNQPIMQDTNPISMDMER